MNALVWNCRGITNDLTVLILHKLIKLKVPFLVFFIKTKINSIEVNKLRRDLGYDKGLIVACDGDGSGRKDGYVYAGLKNGI